MSEEQRLLANELEQEDRCCNKYYFYLLHLLWHGTMLYGAYINKDENIRVLLLFTSVFSLSLLIMLYSYLDKCICNCVNLYKLITIYRIASFIFLSLYVTSIVLLFKSHLYNSTNSAVILILSLYVVFHVIIHITITRKLQK